MVIVGAQQHVGHRVAVHPSEAVAVGQGAFVEVGGGLNQAIREAVLASAQEVYAA